MSDNQLQAASIMLEQRITEDCRRRVSEAMSRGYTAAVAAYTRELAPIFGVTTQAMVTGIGINTDALADEALARLVNRESERVIAAILGKPGSAPLALEQDAQQ